MHTREEQMEAFGRFLDILDELRVKCPWDRKQTNESLRPNTIEETYELCDALMRNDKKDICQPAGNHGNEFFNSVVCQIGRASCRERVSSPV